MPRYTESVPRRRAGGAGATRVDGPRARLDVEERRRQLIELGARLFSSRAYDEVSIDELARAAGISKGLLYHYFPTKRDFYVATVRHAAKDLVDRTFLPDSLEPLERLEGGLDAFLDYVSEHGPAYISLLRSGIGADLEVARIVDETREAFRTRLIEGLPVDTRGPELQLALRGWVGFVEAATIEWLSASGALSRSALRSFLVEALFSLVQVAAASASVSQR
jgi:AcrR family transcriptional regulator